MVNHGEYGLIMVNNKLVGGLELLFLFFFHPVGNVIIPTDFHSIIFQRGRSTTNQIYIYIYIYMYIYTYNLNISSAVFDSLEGDVFAYPPTPLV